MQENEVYDLVIVGGGPAGATAAIYAARANLKTAVLDKGLTTGALGITSKIANYPGIEGEISGAELLSIMRKQAISFGAQFIDDKAIGADLEATPKLIFGNQGVYQARAVVIATGSMGRSNLIKGEAEFLGRGVSYCAVCDAAFFKGTDLVVTGSSDEAVEEALYLTRFARKVTLIAPATELRAPQELVAELEAKPNAEILRGTVVREVLGGKGKRSKVYDTRKEGAGTGCERSFCLFAGGVPVTDWLQGQLELSETGCLRVDSEYQTAIPGVFAVGDVLCLQIKQAVIAAADGAIAAIAADKYLRGRKQLGFDWSK